MISTLPKEELINKVSSCKTSLTVLTAYIKKDSFKMLVDEVENLDIKKVIVIRGRKQDFNCKSSDIEVINIALENGWDIYIHTPLHAKLYCFDDKTAIVGSANLTNSGLDNEHGNLEIVSNINLQADDICKINSIISKSLKINDKIYKLMLDELNETKKNSEKINSENWKFDVIVCIDELFLEDLLGSYSRVLSKKNRNILCIDETVSYNDKLIFDRFVKSNEYLWLYNQLKKSDNKLSFGALSEKLHNSIVCNSRIYRKDVKLWLKDLETWIQCCPLSEIKVINGEHTIYFVLDN